MGDHLKTGAEWLAFCDEHGLTETRTIEGYEVTRISELGEEFLDFLTFMEATILAHGKSEEAIKAGDIPE